jgi:signal transduction histidine kinase
MADSYSVEQILLHLCRNARDAMPSGGRLAIRTEKFLLAHPEKIQVPDLVAGIYVCMTVLDSGVGMDRVTLARLFEPFFTTKEISERSGLGLATVYGIVRQHQGWIDAESELGKGSAFRVYLPAVPKPAF